MKKTILGLLFSVILASSGIASADVHLQSTGMKTHTGWWWFNLPDDGWNWPIYILEVQNSGHASVAITLTLKDLSFVPLEMHKYTINPNDGLNITLNDLWPSHFDYSTGSIDITDYIIEVKVTEQKIDQYFRSWPEIDACFDPEWSDETGCYARYFGIYFKKLPR